MSGEALRRHRNQAEVQWVGLHQLCEGSMRLKELKVRTPVLRVGDALPEVERGTALSRVEDQFRRHLESLQVVQCLLLTSWESIWLSRAPKTKEQM